MIDVRLSNVKLFERATQIVMMVAKVPRGPAVRAILRVLFEGDDLEAIVASQALEMEAGEGGPVPARSAIAKCITVAASKRKVVPTSVLVATGKFTVALAKEAVGQANMSLSKFIKSELV